MNETKKCPICGEEILATAKKCKHCGEWLDQTPAANPSPPNYTLLVVACWVAMFVGVISGIQELEIERERGRFGLLVWVSNNIPEWLVIIVSGGLLVYVVTGLRQYCIGVQKSQGIPFMTYIGLVVATSITASLFVSFADENELLGVVALLLIVANSVVEFIIGLRLKDQLTEHKSVGVAFMALGIVPIMLSLISVVATGDSAWWAIMGSVVVNILLINELRRLFLLQKKYDNE